MQREVVSSQTTQNVVVKDGTERKRQLNEGDSPVGMILRPHDGKGDVRASGESRVSGPRAAKMSKFVAVTDQQDQSVRGENIGGIRLRPAPKQTDHFDSLAVTAIEDHMAKGKELDCAVSSGCSDSSSSTMDQELCPEVRPAGEKKMSRPRAAVMSKSRAETDQPLYEDEEMHCKTLQIYMKRGRNMGGIKLRPAPKQTNHFDFLAVTAIEDHMAKGKELDYAVSSGGSDSSSSTMDQEVCPEVRPTGEKRVSRPRAAMMARSVAVTDQPAQAAQQVVSSPDLFTGRLRGDNLVDPFFGRVVWAKLTSYRPWPAILVNGSLFSKQLTVLGRCWVFWFGEHKVSEISLSQTKMITVDFTQKYNQPKPGKMFTTAVLEALKVCRERCHLDMCDGDEETALLGWALAGFPTDSRQAQEQLCSGGQLPDFVLEHLRRIGEKFQAMQESQGRRNEVVRRRECVEDKEALLAPVRNGDIKIEDVCLACDELNTEVVVQHPLFRGGLCESCKNDLEDCIFAFEADGNRVYCAVCGNGGEQFLCDSPYCGRVYCVGCIEILTGLITAKQIREKETWICFLCSEHSPETHGLLERKPDWRNNIQNLFHHMLPVPLPEKKGPIRVLSLFDGIGTGKYVLDRLGIDVEVYYASEIDESAIAVTKCNLTGNIIQLGDVRSITLEKLLSLGHIDLLIGGSPCNELSLCNPGRKGICGGTGTLYFQFLRIQDLIGKINSGSYFWLFENVASMKRATKEHISATLKMHPVLRDAKYLSAQKRARYFWGNIPGLQCLPPPPDTDHTLQSMLTPNFNRKALVDKIRTVTTKSNSLMQHKERTYPVEMNSVGDKIWIQELERIFGFPEHYTDVCNLSITKRQQLLGKSWSVPVVKHLLYPLRDFFSWKSPASGP